MCGRFSIAVPAEELAERFNALLPEEELFPRYNAAPSQKLPVITNEGDRRIQLVQWGLIPFWAKDPAIGMKMINARAESVAEKPSFRTALQKQRCLVLADGFYEWQKTPGGKTPMRITLKTGEPFAFAGLWDTWKNPDGEPVITFTIITTAANKLLVPIHERMPVILPREEENSWLDKARDKSFLLGLLKSYPPEEMKFHPVSTRVNNAKYDDPSLIKSSGLNLN